MKHLFRYVNEWFGLMNEFLSDGAEYALPQICYCRIPVPVGKFELYEIKRLNAQGR